MSPAQLGLWLQGFSKGLWFGRTACSASLIQISLGSPRLQLQIGLEMGSSAATHDLILVISPNWSGDRVWRASHFPLLQHRPDPPRKSKMNDTQSDVSVPAEVGCRGEG